MDATIDALVDLLTARLPGVDVVDGPPLDWGLIKLPVPEKGDGKRYLFIGAAPDEDTAAEGEQDFNAAGAVSRDERFSVICSSLGFDGAGSMKQARARARALVVEVERMIRDDVTLGDVVLYCRVSTTDRLDEQQNDRGASVTIVFRVACRAYLS